MTAADPTELPTVEHERNRALLEWYEQNRRELPWRETRDPYPTLVSEVMLQQTQVQRVVPFFKAFLRRFPTVGDLAGAPLRDVLEVWSGLGYNGRARRLHLAAIVIATDGWPDTVTGLNGLPGVGPYTANAIACFAWGADAVPVDTNIRRVLSRWHGEPIEPRHLQAIANADATGVSIVHLCAGRDGPGFEPVPSEECAVQRMPGNAVVYRSRGLCCPSPAATVRGLGASDSRGRRANARHRLGDGRRSDPDDRIPQRSRR